MALFDQMKKRQLQKKANNFIESLKNKTEKEIEQEYLNNEEFANNEIVLSYLFFNHQSLIRILPLEFQKSRINSNLSLFREGSAEARKEIVTTWLKENKFFMNSLTIQFDNNELREYLSLYFQYPEYVSIVYMNDLKEVIETLSQINASETEKLLQNNKDKFDSRQWEFIIKVNPSYIKYANQEIQNKYLEDDEYNKFINGQAKDAYINKQLDKVKNDISILKTFEIDIKLEYIKKYPFMINYIDYNDVIEILKYDISLFKYLNISTINKNSDIFYDLIENVESSNINNIVLTYIDYGILNAKGKLYRFDKEEDSLNSQYTKRILSSMQKLNTSQIVSLINIDNNYLLPFVAPLYSDKTSKEDKEKIIIDSNYKCLSIFKEYYKNDDIYSRYYKVINKIFSEYLENYNTYDCFEDYNCVFDLLKVLFDKNIIFNNSSERITVFIGVSLLYRSKNETSDVCKKLLNELLSNAYKKNIVTLSLYDINSMQLYNSMFDFISFDVLEEFNKLNFSNTSSLIKIVSNAENKKLFMFYYELLKEIYVDSCEILYKAVENFKYNKEIIKDIIDKELTEEEEINFIYLLSSFINPLNITKREELLSYDINILKKLMNDLSAVNNSEILKNIICLYLFNIPFTYKGNYGLFESGSISETFDIIDINGLSDFTYDNVNVFDEDDIELLNVINLMFSVDDNELYFAFINDLISNNPKMNIIATMEVFNKLNKYKKEIINKQIVTLNDIVSLSEIKPDVIYKENSDGVDIFKVVDQDFKVLSSYQLDDNCLQLLNTSELEKNCYVYNMFNNNSYIVTNKRGDDTIIKVESKNNDKLYPSYIIAIDNVTNTLIEHAKKNNLSIVSINNEWVGD